MIDLDRLCGHWELAFMKDQADDGGWIDTLGPEPKGSLCYTRDWHMQVLIGARDRPQFTGNWDEISHQDKARCLDRMVAYAGRFTLGEDHVRHFLEISWIPNWEGRREFIRYASFPEEHQLLLTTPKPYGSRPMPVQKLLWKRAAP
jgi:hypothetical protein